MVIEFRSTTPDDTLIATRNLAAMPPVETVVTVGGRNYRISSIKLVLADSGTTKAIVRIYQG